MTTHEQVWTQALIAAIGNDTTKTFSRCLALADAALAAFKERFPESDISTRESAIRCGKSHLNASQAELMREATGRIKLELPKDGY